MPPPPLRTGFGEVWRVHAMSRLYLLAEIFAHAPQLGVCHRLPISLRAARFVGPLYRSGADGREQIDAAAMAHGLYCRARRPLCWNGRLPRSVFVPGEQLTVRAWVLRSRIAAAMALEIQQRTHEEVVILDTKGRLTVGPEATQLREQVSALAAAGSQECHPESR